MNYAVEEEFKGARNIPEEIIESDYWLLVDNSRGEMQVIVEGELDLIRAIKKTDIWKTVLNQSYALKTGKHPSR